jgi:hypothetical protein
MKEEDGYKMFVKWLKIRKKIRRREIREMKSLMCKIGVHDWLVLDINSVGKKYYYDRVCVRCHKIDDSWTRIGSQLDTNRTLDAHQIWRKYKGTHYKKTWRI